MSHSIQAKTAVLAVNPATLPDQLVVSVTMNPTRGSSAPACHSALVTTQEGMPSQVERAECDDLSSSPRDVYTQRFGAIVEPTDPVDVKTKLGRKAASETGQVASVSRPSKVVIV